MSNSYNYYPPNNYGSQQPQQPYQPYQQQPQQPQQPIGHGFFDWIRRQGISRTNDRWLGGVSGGIARRLGWDPLIVRILWFAVFCAAGVGAFFYGLLWLLLPDDRDGTIALEEVIRHGRLRGAFWGSLIMIIIGCPGGIAFPALGAIGIIAAAIALIIVTNNNKNANQPTPQAPYNAASGSSNAYASPTAAPQYQQSCQRDQQYQQNQSNQPNQPNQQNGAQPNGDYFRSVNTGAAPTMAANPSIAVNPPVVYRRKPAGPLIVGLTAGVIILGLAATTWWVSVTSMDISTIMIGALVWLAASILLLGIVTVVCGVTGRKSGGLMGLSILALVAAIMCSPGFAILHEVNASTVRTDTSYGILHNQSSKSSSHAVIKLPNVTLNSTDFEKLQARGVTFNMSEATIDLTDWADSHDSSCPTGTWSISSTASDVTILLPKGCSGSYSEYTTVLSNVTNDTDFSQNMAGSVVDHDDVESEDSQSDDSSTFQIELSAFLSNVMIENAS